MNDSSDAQADENEPADPKKKFLNKLRRSFYDFSDSQFEVLRLVDQAEGMEQSFEDLVRSTETDFNSRVNGGIQEDELQDIFERWIIAARDEEDKDRSEARRMALEDVFDRMPEEQRSSYLTSLLRNVSQPEADRRHTFSALLVMLVSQVELAIRRFAEAVAEIHPESLISKDEKIDLAEVQHLETLAEIKDYVVQKKVDRVLYGSLDDWISFFESKVKIDLKNLIKSEALVEVVQRRHCLVHNGGFASRLYLKNTQLTSIKLGDRFEVDASYVRSAADHLYAFIYSLEWAIAVKVIGRSVEARRDAFGHLATVTFFLLQDRRYRTLKFLGITLQLDDRLKEKRIDDAEWLIIQVNVWLAYKLDGDFDTVRTEVEDWDVHSKPLNFRLAKAALLDQTEDALNLVQAMLISGDINKQNIVTWPLLRDVYPHYKALEAQKTMTNGVEKDQNGTD
ncbi:hypothetical protein [uncultured Corynebacterium sp.]|uniref:hypothetical protein n=1 Tax=uncultured Corynebacterium sp. TaxID=159447 RepID=UPI002598C0C0|nr:hypothetical protein [uncultured Corynebacterium sp.]